MMAQWCSYQVGGITEHKSCDQLLGFRARRSAVVFFLLQLTVFVPMHSFDSKTGRS